MYSPLCTASAVRTEPQSVIGHTGGKKKLAKELLISFFLPSFEILGSVRRHHNNSRKRISGVRYADETFKSRETAEYPSEICDSTPLAN